MWSIFCCRHVLLEQTCSVIYCLFIFFFNSYHESYIFYWRRFWSSQHIFLQQVFVLWSKSIRYNTISTEPSYILITAPVFKETATPFKSVPGMTRSVHGVSARTPTFVSFCLPRYLASNNRTMHNLPTLMCATYAALSTTKRTHSSLQDR